MRTLTLLAALLGLLAIASASPLPKSGVDAFGPFNIDRNSISVSGLSAGGYMTVQFHVAFSSLIRGAAVFAGGPFFCSEGSLSTAEIQCMNEGIGLNIAPLVTKVKGLSTSQIDPPSNLANTRVFTFSGTSDSVVPQTVVKKLNDFYSNFIPASNMSTELTLKAQHCMPTLSYGEACTTLGSPYIGKCNYDGAGTALQYIYGPLKSAVAQNATNLQTFAQDTFISGDSFDKVGYIYIPTACAQNATCKLHINFHGCEQSHTNLGTTYVVNAGFNGWAEANNIIVVYPQVKPTSQLGGNPNGCFDWWGYTDANFAYKTGVQMSAVRKMITSLSGY